jgi:tetratricopeptide (TPR) repeat protein
VPLLGAAAATPFLLLHYPTHIGGALVPLVLLLAHLVAGGPRWRMDAEAWLGRAVAVLLATAAVAVVAWQAARVELDMWVGDSELVLIASQREPPARRAVMTTTVERHAFDRARRSPAAAPWLWRLVGRARLARGDGAGAEEAFRTALALWPHEEAELGLGLALAAQGRPDEAATHLDRVCRVNPSLTAFIGDEQLRRRVEAYLAALAERSVP